MNNGLLTLIFAAINNTVDLIDRLGQNFDNKDELEAYIEKRNEVRENLMELARSLGEDGGGGDPESSDNGGAPVPDQQFQA